jgi:hypothetical protein
MEAPKAKGSGSFFEEKEHSVRIRTRKSEGKRQEGKRLLFLKKKKQKNFSTFGPIRRRRRDRSDDTRKWGKVFLVLFPAQPLGWRHQKKNRFLPLALPFLRFSIGRSKPTKLFPTWRPWPSADRSADGDEPQVDKSFLLLFFKKEDACLPSTCLPAPCPPAARLPSPPAGCEKGRPA